MRSCIFHPVLRVVPPLLAALAITAPVAHAHLSIIRQGAESRGAIEAGDRFGAAIAAGDFNGDGFNDLAVGSPGEDLGGLANAGAVIVSYGSALGITHVGAQLLTPAAIGQTSVAGAQFGFALLAADINQDGRDDLVIGAPFENVGGAAAAGRFYVAYGGAAGFGNTSVAYDQGSAGGAIETNDRFGYAFASGNFDGDGGGFPDLAVGAPGEDNYAGAVSINFMGGFFGLTTGLATTIKQSNLGGTNDENDEFGRALAAGNLVGTTHDDLAIGAPFNGGNLYAELGAVYLVRGSGSGLTTSIPLQYDPSDSGALQSFAQFGYALAVGRFFAGSYSSLAIGVPGWDESGFNDAGRVIVVEGGLSGLDLANERLLNQNSGGSGTIQANDRFGEALAAGEYYDPDGYDDVAIGSPKDGYGVSATIGNFHIFPGGPTGPTGAGWSGFNQGICNEPAEAGDEFGSAMAFGRFDDTGRGGFAVGAPGERFEDTVAEPDLFLDDAGLVNVIAPWRQTFGLSCLRSVVMDCEGDLIFSQKPFERVYIASTTKAMTLLVAAEHIQLPPGNPEYVDPNTDYVVPSWVADSVGGSQFGLWTNEHMTLINLMYACLYRSGNDAAYAIADLVGDGPAAADRIADFVGEMNAKAATLGMNASHFSNPPGLQNEAYGYDLGDHYSTAYDMALLSRAVLQNALTRDISGHLQRDVVRHLTFWGYPFDLPWTINNFFPGMTIPGATGIKGGWTPPAKITGLFSVKGLGPGDAIATTFTTDTIPKKTYVPNATALLQLGLNRCSTYLLLGALDPAPFKLVLPGLSTQTGSAMATSAELPDGGAGGGSGDLAFDVFRQTGSARASARVDLWHTTEVSLPPGGQASLGIGPFWMYRDIRILNMDGVTRRVRVTLSDQGGPVDHTLAPGEELVLPQHEAGRLLSQFVMTLANPDTDPEPIELAVEVIYGFDLTGLGGPDTRPVFSALLKRQGALSNQGISILGSGRDPWAGSELFMVLHEPSLAVGVEADPLGRADDARILSLSAPSPNPFRDRTRLAFDLRETATIEVAIYDLQGRRVRGWPQTRLVPGHWGIDRDGRNDAGGRAGAGVYFARIRVEGKEAGSSRVVLTP